MENVASATRVARPPVAILWAVFYAALAALTALSHFPRLLDWVFEPSSRILSFRYYSPLIEATLVVYVVCAFGFWKGQRWAPWLACLWLIVSAVSRSFLFLLPVGGVDTSQPGVFLSLLDLFRQGPSAWPMAILLLLPRLVLAALLFGPETRRVVSANAEWLSRAFRFADQVIIRVIAVAQLLAFLSLLFMAYGIGFYPPVLAFNLAGATGACLLFMGKRAGRIVLLGWHLLLIVMILVNENRTLRLGLSSSQRYPREVAIAMSAALVCSVYLSLTLWIGRKRLAAGGPVS